MSYNFMDPRFHGDDTACLRAPFRVIPAKAGIHREVV